MSEELQDTDSMPWGKWKGTPMQDVPADYFHWYWVNNGKDRKPGHDRVADYIRTNLGALKMEYPDGIWA
jgi:hypothetical protein